MRRSVEYGERYVGQPPYINLSISGQKAVRDLLHRFDLLGSLGANIAREFRGAVLRSFQGGGFNQYLTEQCVIDFMIDLVAGFGPKTRVLDFECGSGGFLAAAVERGVGLENIRGIDIDELPYVVAKTYLALYFKKSGEWIEALPVKNENGLPDQGSNWDVVIGNPAGGSKYEHGNLVKIGAHLDRDLDRSGKSGESLSEYNLSIQQSVASVKVGGTICLILPEGFFSNAHDEFLRKFVAKHCRVLAIVSLPRGVFKKGTSTMRQGGGAQTASMKMSIFCAKKIRDIDSDNPAGAVDFSALDYPVFIASIDEPGSKSGAVCDWLEPQLEIVREQWQQWSTAGNLKEMPKAATRVPEKNTSSSLLSKKRATPEIKKTKSPTSKSSTKIHESLEDIFRDKS